MILTRLFTTVARSLGAPRRSRHVRELLHAAERLLAAGDVAGAEERLREALQEDPAAAPTHLKLALLLTGQRRLDEAVQHFRAAHTRGILPGAVVSDFVRVLLDRGEHNEAAEVAEAAAARDSSAPHGPFALGLARLSSHRYGEALACFDRALELKPEDADYRTQRGIALQNLGRIPEAVAEYDRALTQGGSPALPRFHRSLALLTNGDYRRGWPEYETRFMSAGLAARAPRYPRWDGAADGRTVLVYGEQGLGDEIMFASCLPDMLRSNIRCIVECEPRLKRLFERSFPEAFVYAAARDKRVPEHIQALGIDAELPCGSLGLHYRSETTAFPQHSGYLRADPRRVALWRARLASSAPALTIGISWQGGTYASRAPLRSIALPDWLPLLRTAGVRFVSLQYTSDAAAVVQAFREAHGIHIEHHPEAIADYDETAALVSALDLTICVCTSVVHLAGALGRPVWVLAPRNAEWRYGHAGGAMPWYPSARVFRQGVAGDWMAVMHSAAVALRAADVWNRAGLDRLRGGNFAAAQVMFETALERVPGAAETHTNLGIALLEQEDEQAGEAHLRAAIDLDPDLLAARENLAALLSARFDHSAALVAWDAVLALDPRHAAAHRAIAFIAAREGRFGDARAALSAAIDCGADRAEVLAQEATMLAAGGDWEGAQRLWREVGSSADSAELKWERALSALSSGAYGDGWPLYEARLDRAISPRRPYPFDAWDGTPVAKGALLILGEQGLGDEIMFASCYADAMERAPHCVIECEPRLAGLFARSFPRARVVAQDRQGASGLLVDSGEIVRQIHAGSLPKLFRENVAAFPSHSGYLTADPVRVTAWRGQLHGGRARRRIGVAWQGGVLHTRRALRTIPPQDFNRMLNVPDIEFVSLQHDDDGTVAREMAAKAGVEIHVYPDVLKDLDDTAALIASLDGVITVCSTVVHLAGALGIPTLVLTPSLPEWRYLREGETSPWYPSVRLLRQSERDRWDGVIDEARARLEACAAGASLINDG